MIDERNEVASRGEARRADVARGFVQNASERRLQSPLPPEVSGRHQPSARPPVDLNDVLGDLARRAAREGRAGESAAGAIEIGEMRVELDRQLDGWRDGEQTRRGQLERHSVGILRTLDVEGRRLSVPGRAVHYRPPVRPEPG